MIREVIRTPANPARMLSIFVWGTLCCLIFAAPLISAYSKQSTFAAILYIFFAPVCHQNHDRSFFIAGHALTVCQRCTGIYLGLLLGSLIPIGGPRLFASPLRRRLLILGLTAPLLLDVVLSLLGVWTNNSLSRFMTGLLFGAMLSTLLVPGVAEILDGALWRARHIGTSRLKGETS